MRKSLLLLFTASLLLIACGTDSNKEKESKKRNNEIVEEFPTTGETMSAEEKKEKLAMLIKESKKTLDSIDQAYKNIRSESRRNALSLEEREQVNEALMELNDAKDLIVLEMQETVVNELKEKTASLKTVMKDMNLRSEKMLNIAQTLSRVSGVIEKTADLLAGALSIGLVRPKLPATTESPS